MSEVERAVRICRRAIDNSAKWEWPGDRGAWVAAQVIQALTGIAPTRHTRVLCNGHVEMQWERWDPKHLGWVPTSRSNEVTS